MTSKEAVDLLENKILVCLVGEWRDALEQVINALKAQESCNQLATNLQPCKQDADDLISRAAAIDAVEFGITYAKAINVNTGEGRQLFKEGNDALKKAVERIKDLQSAQPETHEERTETHACDCISRKEAIDAFGLSEKTRKYGGDHSGYDTRMLYEIQDVLENLPSAQPERAGRCVWCDGIEGRRLRIEFYWIDDDGNTASFSEPHIVATGIAKYCPECGRKLKMEVEHDYNELSGMNMKPQEDSE